MTPRRCERVRPPGGASGGFDHCAGARIAQVPKPPIAIGFFAALDGGQGVVLAFDGEVVGERSEGSQRRCADRHREARDD
jgi:hypothetical protein